MADEVLVVFSAEVDGYNAQIKSAIGANDKLEASAETTSNNISKDFANTGKAIQQAFAGKEVSNSLNATKKSAESLKGEIKKLYDEEVKLLKISKNVANDGVKKVRDEANLLRSALDKAGQTINNTGSTLEKAAKKGQTLTAQLRGLKQEISQLESSGQGGSKAFTDLTIKAAKLEDQIGDTRERVRVLASDTFKFDAAVGGIQALAGAFVGVQSGIALFGEESEEVNKALLKVQASLGLVAAAQELANLVTGQGALKLAIITGAQALFSSAIDVTTKKLNVFKAALISTGIGALVVTFGFLIEKILEFNKTAEESAGALKRLSDANVKLREESIQADRKLALARKQITQEEFDRQERVIAQVKVRRTAEVEVADAIKKAEAELESAREKQRLSANRQGGGNLDVGIQLVKRAEENKVKVIKEGQERIRLINENFSKEEQAINLKLQEEITKGDKKVSDKKIEIKQQENFDLAALLNEEINAQLRTRKIIAETAVIEEDSIKNKTALIKASLDVQVALLEENFKNDEEREAERVRLVAEAQAAIVALNKQANDEIEEDENASFDQRNTNFRKYLAKRAHENRDAQKAQEDLEKSALDLSIQATNATFDLFNSIGDARIAKLEENAAKEIALAGDDAKKKEGIERKLADEVAKIKRSQAIADKAQALFNIAINTATAVSKAAATPALIPLIVALGAIQAAAVAARPIPKFEKGGLVKGARHSQGGVLAELEGDEFIANRGATRKNRALLEAINTGKEKEFIFKRFQVPIIEAARNENITQKLNAKLDSARMERELQTSRKAEKNNTDKIVKAVLNNKSPRYNWN